MAIYKQFAFLEKSLTILMYVTVWHCLTGRLIVLPFNCTQKHQAREPALLYSISKKVITINLLGFPNNSLIPAYTTGWREAL